MTTIAENIQAQIGGRTFYMLGSWNHVDHGDALGFRIRGSRTVNHVKVTLTSRDLYDVEFGKIYGHNYRVVRTVEGIYADMLHRTIESNTGLYTNL